MLRLGKLDTSRPPRIPRRPPPSYRNASPSGPWPWMDLDSDIADGELSPVIPRCPIVKWVDYPKGLFPNWTEQQVRRSGINKALTERQEGPCTIYNVDVLDTGKFKRPGEYFIDEHNKDELWEILQAERPSGIRVRAVFIENISGPVLQMFGTRYNIEPFYFSSSLNKIPSRYQEDVRPHEGDHITITLTFLRSMIDPAPPSLSMSHDTLSKSSVPIQVDRVLDPHAPLSLHSNGRILMLDEMAVHMVRLQTNSTIISYHAKADWYTTTAKELHKLLRLASQSVYWRKILQQTSDPTFVLLTILWHAIYSWDEALSSLYTHVQSLETKAIRTNESALTQELHIIRAHLLHYISLLEDFRKSVQFIKDTPNPAIDPEVAASEKELLSRECDTLLSEIARLEMVRDMQNKRLKNVMNLVFATVNIVDSQHAKALTETAARDSNAMKQISYLTMVFLPASFSAAVFGMNVTEINTGSVVNLARYVELALPLTAVTVWIIISVQSKTYLDDTDPSMWSQMWWPLTAVRDLLRGLFRARWRKKTDAGV